MQYYFQDELCHHGVKGMKWGIRKQRKLVKSIKKNRGKINSEWKEYMPKDENTKNKIAKIREQNKKNDSILKQKKYYDKELGYHDIFRMNDKDYNNWNKGNNREQKMAEDLAKDILGKYYNKKLSLFDTTSTDYKGNKIVETIGGTLVKNILREYT